MHGFHLWCFNDEWYFGEASIVEDIGKCGCADIALTDVLVPIHAALIFRFCVVEMEGFESLKPDNIVKLIKSRFAIRFGSHVVAGGKDMARIQTDPKPIWVFCCADDIS